MFSSLGDQAHAAGETVSAQLQAQCSAAFTLYQQMLGQGVARELARMILPLNTYSVMMVKMNAHAL